MNKGEVLGAPGYLNNLKGDNPKPPTVLRTKQACMYSQLRRELHEASKMTDDFIETDFLNGVQQRMLRIEFMREINLRLKHEQPDPLEQMEQAEWAHIKKLLEAHKKKEELELKILDSVGVISSNGGVGVNKDLLHELGNN